MPHKSMTNSAATTMASSSWTEQPPTSTTPRESKVKNGRESIFIHLWSIGMSRPAYSLFYGFNPPTEGEQRVFIFQNCLTKPGSEMLLLISTLSPAMFTLTVCSNV